MDEQSNFIATLFFLPFKVLNPYFEVVACLAQKSRVESRRYFGRETAMIKVAYTKQQSDGLFQNRDSWAIVFAQFEGQLLIFSQLIIAAICTIILLYFS